MTDGDSDDEAADIVGQPVEAAAAAVADRVDTPDDEDAVAATLRTVSEDGVVSLDAVDDAIADASMYLSTAEGRVEYAAVEFRETREGLDDVRDVEFVRTRLDGFEQWVAVLEDDAKALAERLQTLIKRKGDPGRLYETASELAQIKTEADRVQGRADKLLDDVASFESIVAEPERGIVDLLGDLNALAGFLDDLEATIEEIDGAVSDEVDTDEYDPARVWFEASVRHRLNGLVFDDVRAELGSIRQVATERGVETLERDDDVLDRLAKVRERWTDLGDRLDEVAPAAWHARYDDRLDAVDARTAEAEPPIDWDAVESDLGEYLAE
jgi:chromosome segregation ATPase